MSSPVKGSDPADYRALFKKALVTLDDLKRKLALAEKARSEPIAIIGMACRFPGQADDPDGFWRLLSEGTDAIRDVPVDRWDADAFYDPDPDAPGKMYTRRGAFLDRVDLFDAPFFGISPREAVSMDPQQRLLLEVSWEALEDAGQAPDRLAGSRTGVFVGISPNEYAQQLDDAAGVNPYTGTGGALSVASGRLSYVFGLQGPNVAVDTACSSSLVALQLACQSLRYGQSQMALAGGVNLLLAPGASVYLSKLRALSPDGRCHTFAADASGYGRGEGCGMVVLKRLSDAQAAGDRILALIRGASVNHDGRSSGLTVPNGNAQQAVIREALADGKVAPADVSYVEAHGTGTPLGDPIETRALGAVLGEGHTKDRPLVVGSAKTNIGHLEAAAGVAGLVKVVLALQHEEIPPHLHFATPSPHIAWDELPVLIPTERLPWKRGDRRRIAGLSSFGFSGTNAHVILEEAPEVVVRPADGVVERPLNVWTMSAKSDTALQMLAGRFEAHLARHPGLSLADAAFTANTGRARFGKRAAVLAGTVAEARGKLKAVEEGRSAPGVSRGEAPLSGRVKVAFLFTGQGSQYAGMGRGLYEGQPAFRKEMERCQEILRPLLPRPLLEVVYPRAGEEALIDETAYTQPGLFALEWSLCALWRSWGVEPGLVLGHSVGEYVAGCVAGLFSLEDGLRLIAERGRLMQALPPGGEMAAVFAEVSVVQEVLQGQEGLLSVAAVNGPENVVLSGSGDALRRALGVLQEKGIKSKGLTVSHAFHSPLMEPMLSEFRKAAEAVTYHNARMGIVANATGKLARPGEMETAEYWVRHLREPVQFSESMRTLSEKGYEIFVEVGPGPTLLGIGRRCLGEAGGTWLPTLRKGKEDWDQVLESVSELWVRGVEVDWEGFDAPYGRRRVALPTYPFERERYWIESMGAPTSQAVNQTSDSSDWLYTVEWEKTAEGQVSPAPGNWLIFGDGSPGSELADHLRTQGHAVRRVLKSASDSTPSGSDTLIDPSRAEDYDAVLAAASGVPPVTGVVFLGALAEGSEGRTTASLERSQERVCGDALRLIQALARQAGPLSPRLWLVTRGAQPLGGGPVSLEQATLWGLGRTLAVEQPGLRCVRIDLDPASSDVGEALAKELLGADAEDQIALRGGQRHVARLAPLTLAASPPGAAVRADATYLVTGGLGALGLQVARWLVDRGARHLVLTGRRGAVGAAVEAVRSLEAAGARVEVVRADVSNEAEARELVAGIARDLPALRGVVHAAGILDDGVLGQLDWARFSIVMAPKVAGAWNLHTLTEDLDLDFFVLFSSVASVLGSAGQGNYAAGNAFLDALAHFRRTLGLPGLSVNWGAWAESGMAARQQDRDRGRRSAQGIGTIPPDLGMAVLERLLSQGQAQVTVVPIDWSRLFSWIPAGKEPALFARMAAAHGRGRRAAAEVGREREALAAAHPEERSQLLDAMLRDQASLTLGVAPGRIDARVPLTSMGLDSLMAVEFRNAIEARTGVCLPLAEVLEGPSLSELLDRLLRALDDAPGQTAPAPAVSVGMDSAAAVALLAKVDEISDAEVEALLGQILPARRDRP